jgi:hypothetical protein
LTGGPKNALKDAMAQSATDVMHAILVSAVIEGVGALKDASKGMPNTLMRDLNAIHPNTTFGDLPKELQAAITASVRGAFTRLLKEGYAVMPRDAAAHAPSPARRHAPDKPRPPRGSGPRRGGPKPPRR